MLSFSVNKGFGDIAKDTAKAVKVSQLIQQLNVHTAAYIGSAYIDLVGTKNDGVVNMGTYKSLKEKENISKQIKHNFWPILTEGEVEAGHKGISEVELSVLLQEESFEKELLSKAEKEQVLEDFGYLEKLIFVNEGLDFYRILYLVKTEGFKKQLDLLRELCERYNIVDFVKLILSVPEYWFAISEQHKYTI